MVGSLSLVNSSPISTLIKNVDDVMDIKKFESTYKIAKPLRLFGLIFFILKFLMMIELFQLAFNPYFDLLSIICYSAYIVLLMVFYRNQESSL